MSKMKISKQLIRTFTAFLTVAVLFFAAENISAQTDTTPKKRLKNPATVKGLIGGEAHDSYVIRARKNQILNVQIS